MSFMDRKNVLSEGFFDSLKKLIALKKKIDKDKKLMKNPKVKKALANLDKQLDKYTKSVEKAAQGLDMKDIDT